MNLPIFKKDVQGFDLDDLMQISGIALNHVKLFMTNSQNYRDHALNEISLNLLSDFKNQLSDFLKGYF